MNEQINTLLAERRPVTNFCMLSPEGLQHITAELGIGLSPASLLHCRDYFGLKEHRDPTVGELRFLDALAQLQATLPAATFYTGTAGSEEDRRIFADILRQNEALLQSGEAVSLQLNGLQSMSGKYLARCGVSPYHKSLKCGHVVEFSALGLRRAQGPMLTLGSVAATQMPPPSHCRNAAHLLLLFPTGRAPFEREVADFFDTYTPLGLIPLAVPHAEGVFPHLLALKTNVTVDTAHLPYFNPYEGLAPLASYGKSTVLFAAPQSALPALLGRGLPVTLLGEQTAGRGRLTLRHGNLLNLTVGTALLHALHPVYQACPTLPKRTERLLTSGETREASTLLMGMTAEGGCMHSLLHMIGRLVAAGGDPKRLTLTAVLELPPMSEQVQSEAIVCLLDLHRVTCELALPSCHHRQITRPGLTAPRLSVFVAAEQGAPRGAEFVTAWEVSVQDQRFDVMRAMLHPAK